MDFNYSLKNTILSLKMPLKKPLKRN